MRNALATLALALSLSALPAHGDDSTLEAAVGGGIGGAVGGAVGNELGGREGAIIGAGVGAAAGAAIATSGERDRRATAPSSSGSVAVQHDPAPRRGTFCPPGQAKKGRC